MEYLRGSALRSGRWWSRSGVLVVLVMCCTVIAQPAIFDGPACRMNAAVTQSIRVLLSMFLRPATAVQHLLQRLGRHE